MIISACLTLIYVVFALLTQTMQIEMIPDAAIEFAYTIGDYLSMGVGILSVYTDFNYLLILFGIIVSVDVSVMVYKFVMWILRKFPFIDIS